MGDLLLLGQSKPPACQQPAARQPGCVPAVRLPPSSAPLAPEAAMQSKKRSADSAHHAEITERKSLNLDFQGLKDKGYQPYFRRSLLKYYTGGKTHTCDKGKAGRIPAAV